MGLAPSGGGASPAEPAATDPTGSGKQGAPAPSSYKGLTWAASQCKFMLRIRIPGKQIYLGVFAREQAEEGARLHDCVNIWLHGLDADLNFDRSCYNAEELEAALTKLRRKQGVVWEHDQDVKWLGVAKVPHTLTWRPTVLYKAPTGTHDVMWRERRKCEEAAARQADLGALAVYGLDCKVLNFKASSYTRGDLEAVGARIKKYAVEERLPELTHAVDLNLQAVAQVCLVTAWEGQSAHCYLQTPVSCSVYL
jgi:hypothetical protein